VRRVIAIVALVMTVAACSTSTSFHKEGEVCYRTREHHSLGIRTDKSTVQALDENCE
jgi:hypothetical protein